MKISIITINYNNAVGLEKTINSVVQQNYKLEYIVIDGGSTDGSQVIIERYKTNITHSLSEQDSGIYNAMNKGISLATGDYLLFINSGDILTKNTAIQEVVNRQCAEDLIICDLVYIKDGKKQIWIPENKLRFDSLYHHSIPHPSTFIKRALFDLIGPYDESLKIVSDWKFFMLAICKHNCTYKRLPFAITEFDEGGMSTDPNNYPLIVTEKQLVFEEFFSAFVSDYNELWAARKLLKKLRYVIKLKNFFRSK